MMSGTSVSHAPHAAVARSNVNEYASGALSGALIHACVAKRTASRIVHSVANRQSTRGASYMSSPRADEKILAAKIPHGPQNDNKTALDDRARTPNDSKSA